ncbi:hypothetical protein [Crossiella sp. NPDC003009]
MDQRGRFIAAQQDQLRHLREATADRPAHARYLAALEQVSADRIDDVEPGAGVSARIAQALRDDVAWCRMVPPARGGFTSPFPGSYAALRLRAARAVAERARTTKEAGTLSGLLRLRD